MANIILVHGAFVDGSCWAPLIPLLSTVGHRVVAVQNPSTTLEDDVASVKRAMREVGNGPTVVVGHSYGGMVISAAVSGERHVIGQVFVAALAGEKGQSVFDILRSFPETEGIKALRTDVDGWSIMDRDAFPAAFAGDLPFEGAQIMAACQPRLGPTCFHTKFQEQPSWRTLRTWYLICEQDHFVHPEVQRALAKKMGAQTISIEASHAAMISQSEIIAEAINQAALRKAYVTG